jgi:hypothetical protein
MLLPACEEKHSLVEVIINNALRHVEKKMMQVVKVTRDSNLMPLPHLEDLFQNATGWSPTYLRAFECSGYDLLFVTLAINSLYCYQ